MYCVFVCIIYIIQYILYVKLIHMYLYWMQTFLYDSPWFSNMEALILLWTHLKNLISSHLS